ncbi:hypothetical protein ACIRBX_01970 [Kitasatospora sp. NPDC096147]|uniref:hypothetical protein n=1 Tax=Kitasatospora sp. NPDC096147 TaxID=3364093 RepID=UPI0037F103DD
MPGQRKRRRKQQEERQRRAAEWDARPSGRWEVLLSTQDPEEQTAFLRDLLTARPELDPSELRGDMFCGRGVFPTTYQLSVFVPDDPDPTDPPPDPDPPLDPPPDVSR